MFWAPVAVVPDTTYYLVFTSTNFQQVIAGAGTNPYTRGQMYANAGYQACASSDYAFETYAQVGGVPEPATLVLTGLGLAGVLVLSRRRRRAA